MFATHNNRRSNKIFYYDVCQRCVHYGSGIHCTKLSSRLKVSIEPIARKKEIDKEREIERKRKKVRNIEKKP